MVFSTARYLPKTLPYSVVKDAVMDLHGNRETPVTQTGTTQLLITPALTNAGTPTDPPTTAVIQHAVPSTNAPVPITSHIPDRQRQPTLRHRHHALPYHRHIIRFRILHCWRHRRNRNCRGPPRTRRRSTIHHRDQEEGPQPDLLHQDPPAPYQNRNRIRGERRPETCLEEQEEIKRRTRQAQQCKSSSPWRHNSSRDDQVDRVFSTVVQYGQFQLGLQSINSCAFA